MDIETILKINKEEKHYQSFLQSEKNRILRIIDTTKKQAEWSKLFGTRQPDDSYLEYGEVF